MKAVPAEEFLRWAAEKGIRVDEMKLLTMPVPREFARFWVLPHDPTSWPFFIGILLGGLDNWSTGHLWPRSGRWPEFGKAESDNEAVRDVVLRGIGVPSSFSGAMHFDRDEKDALISILFVSLLFGWCVDDDLFFIPDHGCQLMQTDHHDVIHVECLYEERIQELIAHMAGAGYDLPTELPDGTFKLPVWMGKS